MSKQWNNLSQCSIKRKSGKLSKFHYMCMHDHVCVYVCVCVYICVCVFTYVYMSICNINIIEKILLIVAVAWS